MPDDCLSRCGIDTALCIAGRESSVLGNTLSVLHTGPVTVEPLGRLLREAIPGVRIINMVDDSLLRDVMTAGKLTQAVTRRTCQYMMIAEDMGADVILNACSSVGEVVDIARNLVGIPLIRIDEAMAEKAVENAQTIGVVATVKTTLDPTVRLIERKASERGRKVVTRVALCSGAFEALLSGNGEKHDELLSACVSDISKIVDMVVLAQASMARLAPKLENRVEVPVLSSPGSGVEHVKRVMAAL